MKASLRVAVRALVEHLLRTGDFHSVFSGASRTRQAIRAHQRIQQSRPRHYLSEVPLLHEITTNRFCLQVGGRIDGVYEDPSGSFRVEEIKTTLNPPREIGEENNPVHWGQLKVYAYLFALQKGLQNITARLVYVHLETGETFEVVRQFKTVDLSGFFEDLTGRYLKWAETIADWQSLRNRTIQDLEFPFSEYRKGQKEMAVAVYRSILYDGQLFIQAATGIGKTMATLFPALKALGENHSHKIFFLTARTTARVAAEEALNCLRKAGLKLKSLTLTAKDKICFESDANCTPSECSFAQGYYDRVNMTLEQMFTEDTWNRQAVEAAATSGRICPFEFSLELANWADIIICDYNYAFDPRVYLRRFFQEGQDKYTFLVDEAHNLVDRSREMFSAELQKQPFLDVRKGLRKQLPDLYRIMGKINRALLDRRNRIHEKGIETDFNPPEDLFPVLADFIRGADRWLSLNKSSEFRKDLLELYFTVVNFVRVAESFDDAYVTISEMLKNNLRIKLFCMDPSPQLRDALHRCRAAIFFSATLTPAHYFKTLFGCDPEAESLQLPSPFPVENQGIFLMDRVSTLYRHREKTAATVSRALAAFIAAHRGNYLLFFPSYAYLKRIYSRFTDENPHIRTIVQSPGMSESEREAFLRNFTETNSETIAGFAVMGGIFGEGIDLAGERLCGAAIVGVGLPGISPERELIREYFEMQLNAGFSYAYRFPGINRVLQAAGRVIRSSQDHGAVLLIDSRFSQNAYQELLPFHWQPVCVRDDGHLKLAIGQFWKDFERN